MYIFIQDVETYKKAEQRRQYKMVTILSVLNYIVKCLDCKLENTNWHLLLSLALAWSLVMCFVA